jgi:hypothetical protein
VCTPGQQQLPCGAPLGRHGRGSRCCWCRPWPPRRADLANGAASAGAATYAGRARGHRAADDAAAHASGSQGGRAAAAAANARHPIRAAQADPTTDAHCRSIRRPQGGLAADAVGPDRERAHAVRGTASIGVDTCAPAGLRSPWPRHAQVVR